MGGLQVHEICSQRLVYSEVVEARSNYNYWSFFPQNFRLVIQTEQKTLLIWRNFVIYSLENSWTSTICQIASSLLVENLNVKSCHGITRLESLKDEFDLKATNIKRNLVLKIEKLKDEITSYPKDIEPIFDKNRNH